MEITIDMTVFEGMPDSLITKLVGMWEMNAKKCLEDLQNAVAAKDEKATHALLHSLKGVSAQVGAVTLSSMASQMEKQLPIVQDVKKLIMLDILLSDTVAVFACRGIKK
jgi:HPt (histidine-containing phosphotransfer) domain-containing protein